MNQWRSGRRGALRAIGAAGILIAAPGSFAVAQESSKGGAKKNGKEGHEPTPAEDLMQEHGLLNRVLLIYEESLRRMAAGELLPNTDVVKDAATIVRDYIENHHAKLEENHIFPVFEAARQHVDLVKVLRQQHEAGRKLTDRVRQFASSAALKSPVERGQLENALRDFIRMYRPHEAREDTVLFPALRKLMPAPEYAALAAKFRQRERALPGSASLEQMVERVASLERELGTHDLAKFTPRA